MIATDIEIRPLTEADSARYREIRLESLRLCPATFSVTLEMESSHSLEWFAKRLSFSRMVGAFQGDEIVGIAGFLVHQGNCAHSGRIIAVYVRERFRNQNVGRRLMEAILAIAAEHVELVQLSVLSENLPARRLYSNLGFEEYGIERKSHKYAGRYYDQVLMMKELV